MGNSVAGIAAEIKSRIKEAETYYTMGLPRESLELYENILHDSKVGAGAADKLNAKIKALKEEIKLLDDSEPVKFSEQDIEGIKGAISTTNENAPAIYESAFAFKELGLYNEAISEYEKLIDLDYPFEMVIPEFMECLEKVYPSMQVIGQIETIIGRHDFSDEESARIRMEFGMDLERRDDKELALYFYESATKLDPKNEEIQDRLNSVAAHFATGSKYDYLLKNGIVNTNQLQEAFALSKKKKKSVEFLLTEHFKIKKEDVGKSLSECYGHEFKAFNPDAPTPTELLSNLKKLFLFQDLWVPLGWEKDGIEVLIDDPINLNKIDIVNALLNSKKTKFYVGIKEDIESYIHLFFDNKPAVEPSESESEFDDYDVIPDISFEEEDEEPEEQSSEYNEASGKVVKLVDQVIVAAYRKNSSDIHVEPSPLTKTTIIRFRMDGVCQEYLQVPNSMAKGILSRIKIMSGLDIAERRMPQDGKIKFKRKGIPSFELRVATLPTTGGYEDAVLRILAKAGAMKLDDMGLNERNLNVMKKLITQPYGLVLVVGPTGSGKTTSLHSALGYINKPGIKIWTAEDPVEITQQGMRQVEAKPKIGLDFARIMRAFLRADPDVIMIGEMRDNETASIGVEASLTGHLVFSTLHTNSAPETVTRLLDMGLNPLNFSDAFLGVMAQRLVRKLCDNCREAYNPSEDEFREIVMDYGEEQFQATGIKYSSDLTLYRPAGCDACSHSGYKGRLGIHELMEGTPELKKLIKNQANTEKLLKVSVKDGMTSLKQDAIVKMFNGLTDLAEIRRVCIN